MVHSILCNFREISERKTLIRLYSQIVIILLATVIANAQTTSKDKIYKTYDQLVSLDNTSLFNGTEFTDLFLNTNGTFRYLGGFDYAKGSVVYKDQYFTDVLLKYDVFEDDLLTKSNDNLSIFEVKLIPEFVSEFKLHDRRFVRMTVFGKSEFFELAYEGNSIDLYVKHKMKKREKALKSGVQYSFKPINYYIFKYKENYIKVESINELRRALPEVKDDIKDFRHTYKTLYKQDRDGFMTKLAAYLNKLPEMDNL